MRKQIVRYRDKTKIWIKKEQITRSWQWLSVFWLLILGFCAQRREKANPACAFHSTMLPGSCCSAPPPSSTAVARYSSLKLLTWFSLASVQGLDSVSKGCFHLFSLTHFHPFSLPRDLICGTRSLYECCHLAVRSWTKMTNCLPTAK